jgi:hypothetical protein
MDTQKTVLRLAQSTHSCPQVIWCQMCVPHGHPQIPMPQQLRHGAQIHPLHH